MSLTDALTFVVASNSAEILANNLFTSPCFRSRHNHQMLVQKNYSSAAAAYNDALRRAKNELVIFIHQDMFLPGDWISKLSSALECLEKVDRNWGVLGCWGAKRNREYCGHIYSSGWGILGAEFERPESVQTLDEIILIFRKSSGLSFDQQLPHFHFYGTDICMRAAKRG